MIRIKDLIINENEIVYIGEIDAQRLGIMLKGKDKGISVDAHIEDIKWNYDKEVVRKALDNDIDLRTKIQELEEKNKTFEDYNKDLNNQLDKLEKRIDKALLYIEEYYDNFGWKELRPSNLKELMEILNGEE